MDVIVLKLSNGEEVIARGKHNGAGAWSIQKPRVIVMAPTQQGIQIAIMPWVAADVDGDYNVSDNHVITHGKPTEALEKQYLEQTTGLEIAKG